MTDYPWFQDLKQGLVAQHQAGRLPHALLITAMPGWGVSDLADWLALTLLQVASAAHPAAQGARTLAHPDLRWIEALEGGREIKIDQIRTLNDFAYGTVQSGAAKVAVVDDAQRMNRAAANALLKTLEEPPANTYLILTTTRPGRLPATILSRTQRFRIAQNKILAQTWLQQQTGLADVSSLTQEFGGAPLPALQGHHSGLPGLSALADQLHTPDAHKTIKTMLEHDMTDLVARWQRLLIARMSQEREGDRGLYEFADELNAFLAQVEASNSANTALGLERLAYRWQALESARTHR